MSGFWEPPPNAKPKHNFVFLVAPEKDIYGEDINMNGWECTTCLLFTENHPIHLSEDEADCDLQVVSGIMNR